MKRLLLTGSLALLWGLACAQKLSSTEVPGAIRTSFAAKFTNATQVKWEKEGARYEAEFRQGSRKLDAVYSSNGTFVQTEEDLPASSLPPAAVKYIREHYKNTRISEASRITKADGTVEYEASVGKKDLLFDAKGAFIMVEEEGDEDEENG